MTLQIREGQPYGDDHADIAAFLAEYSAAGYPTEHYANLVCECAGRTFALTLDDNEGAAVRVCTACKTEHPIGDSEDYLEDAELEECACPCGCESLELTVGVALYSNSRDVRWIYIGARCPDCGMIGCYGDWKNEFTDFAVLLARA